MLTQTQAATLYNVARKWLTIISFALSPVLMVFDAPFGRFSPASDSVLLVDGVKSWMLMETVSPAMFTYTFIKAPLSYSFRVTFPQIILAAMFLVHYWNRAILSPLRTPSRSKAHISVTISGVIYNIFNGAMMGSYLSSPFARIFLTSAFTFRRRSFYVGLALWALGFAGNLLHDEILLDIRRKAKEGKKEKESNGKASADETQEHYGIPQGWLYNYVSYPNYLCEWVEWLGFALAAAPLPLDRSSLTLSSLLANASPKAIATTISNPAYLFAQNLAPPYIFLLSEVLLMFPRAYRGHRWYRKKFGDSYPKNRKVVVPFVL